ncbi:helix-turn-helix transcriptional regulator [Paenibacillus kribbensis]|uniref:helix-turn-helix transcriptional regulator n=1 Tax=Paenibacillus kribbensis TaxID=172713 RepID=UPI0015BEA5ED|nr:AraC family transcriptional regulator [Paenibacillus kribbensis]
MDLAYHEHLIPQIFLFVDRKCFADWSIRKARIDFHDLTFVISGKACYYINEEKVIVEAGDLLYIPEGCTREAHTFGESPMHCYPFNFHWAAPYNDVRLPFGYVSKKMITKEILDYIREFKQVWMNRQPFYTFQARALFELILHRLLSNDHLLSATTMDPRIQKATYYINEHYSDDITVGILAEQANLNTVYFGKLFKETTGSTCKEYLNRIRINNAEMMLSSGDFNVSETAERCGFHDISYFSNLFKMMRGYSPSSARKKQEL